MFEVKRSTLRGALTRYLSEERTQEILTVLEPLFIRCAYDHYPFGDPANLDQAIAKHVAVLTNRTCTSLEPMSERIIPHSMTGAVCHSNFLAKVRPQAGLRIEMEVSNIRASNLDYDVRMSFGNRLFGRLSTNLWQHLWTSVRLWLLAEIAGKPLQKEAEALEQIVRLGANGLIVFDFKPTNPSTVLVVCDHLEPNMRYRKR